MVSDGYVIRERIGSGQIRHRRRRVGTSPGGGVHLWCERSREPLRLYPTVDIIVCWVDSGQIHSHNSVRECGGERLEG